MVQGVRGKRAFWLWAACALSAACEADKAAPGVEFDPNLVEDGGEDRWQAPPVAGSRADAGADAAPQDAAPGASDAEADDGGVPDAAQAGDASSPSEPGALESAERLLIADGLAQRVYAYDVPSRRLLESFAIGARARVHAGPSGRYGYALPSEVREVRIIDMGFVREQGSAQRLAPAVLSNVTLAGAGPIALLAQADWVALFFGGEAELRVLRESGIPAGGDTPETEDVWLGGSHPGFGLPFDGGYLATQLEGGEVMLRRYENDGSLDSAISYACAAPEAAALAAGALAVGCDAGILRIAPGAEPHLIPYPDEVGTERARRLAGHPDDALYLTVLGERLCLVGASQLSCQALAQPALDFGFDASGKRALALGSDGALRVFDAESLQPLGMVRVTSAVSSSDPLQQPHLASGRRFTYVSDPQASSVHMVDPATLALAGRLEIPGAPASLAVFGFR